MKNKIQHVVDLFVILTFAFLSPFTYARSFHTWFLLIKKFLPNILIMAFVFFTVEEILETFSLNSPSFIIEKEISPFSRFVKISLGVGSTYIVESFIFFSHSLGRLTYITFFLLNLLYFVPKKYPAKPKVFWSANLDHKKIIKKYMISFNLAQTPEQAQIIVANGRFPYKKDLFLNLLERENFLLCSPAKFVEHMAKLIPLDLLKYSEVVEEVMDGGDKEIYEHVKRIVEIPVAILTFAFLFPIAFILSLVHQLESPGSIFYLQRRLGKGGKEFKIIKFRTMVPNAERKGGPSFATHRDPRITKIGKIMRKLHLDEVPQLINVIKGDMSLVGPRPERPEIARNLERHIPLYPLRTKIKPGITGWAQIHFGYAGDNIQQHKRKLEYDLFYIKHRNLALDLHILYKTFFLFLSPAID